MSEGDDLFEFVADRLDPLPVLLLLILLTPFFVDVELDPFVFTCSSLIASPLDDFEPVGLVLAMTNRDDVELVPLEDDADIVAVDDDAELVSVSLGFDDEDDEKVLLLELPVEFELLVWTL